MTAADLRELLTSLGLTQAGGARLLGVDGRTMRRWVLGERKVDETAARFLRFIQAAGIKPEAVMDALNPKE